MRKLCLMAALLALLPPIGAAAQNAFDGTWKLDVSGAHISEKPIVFEIQHGVFECKSCVPAVKVKADGSDQPVSGSPYIDAMAVTIVNDHEINETHKKDGKVVTTVHSTVSPDGNTLTFAFTDSSNTNGGAPVTTNGTATRIAKGPEGSHLMSGSWRTAKIDSVSDNGVVWSYKTNGNQLTMTTPTGQSYTAKLDGTEAPMKGDPGVTTVLVRMIGANTLEETDKRDGKVIVVMQMTIGPDGKSAKVRFEDKLADRTDEFSAIKQ